MGKAGQGNERGAGGHHAGRHGRVPERTDDGSVCHIKKLQFWHWHYSAFDSEFVRICIYKNKIEVYKISISDSERDMFRYSGKLLDKIIDVGVENSCLRQNECCQKHWKESGKQYRNKRRMQK